MNRIISDAQYLKTFNSFTPPCVVVSLLLYFNDIIFQ